MKIKCVRNHTSFNYTLQNFRTFSYQVDLANITLKIIFSVTYKNSVGDFYFDAGFDLSQPNIKILQSILLLICTNIENYVIAPKFPLLKTVCLVEPWLIDTATLCETTRLRSRNGPQLGSSAVSLSRCGSCGSRHP